MELQRFGKKKLKSTILEYEIDNWNMDVECGICVFKREK